MKVDHRSTRKMKELGEQEAENWSKQRSVEPNWNQIDGTEISQGHIQV